MLVAQQDSRDVRKPSCRATERTDSCLVKFFSLGHSADAYLGRIQSNRKGQD